MLPGMNSLLVCERHTHQHKDVVPDRQITGQITGVKYLSDTIRQLLMIQPDALWLVQGHQGFMQKALQTQKERSACKTGCRKACRVQEGSRQHALLLHSLASIHGQCRLLYMARVLRCHS